MLVEFARATQPNPENENEVRRAAILPEGVAAYFEDERTPGVSIIRFMDGRGFQVRGTYDEVKERLGVPMIEFERALRQASDDEPIGEDDGLEERLSQPARKVAVKPQAVSAVFESTQAPEVVIIRLLDGRGLQVRGNYAQVHERLTSAGYLATQPGEEESVH